MATDTGRDDFIIAIRSAFLKKGTRQKFSLFTLLIISILVLFLEYFKSGPIDTFRSITKDVIFKGSFFISEPFVYIKKNYYNFKEHLQMYEKYTELKKLVSAMTDNDENDSYHNDTFVGNYGYKINEKLKFQSNARLINSFLKEHGFTTKKIQEKITAGVSSGVRTYNILALKN